MEKLLLQVVTAIYLITLIVGPIIVSYFFFVVAPKEIRTPRTIGSRLNTKLLKKGFRSEI